MSKVNVPNTVTKFNGLEKDLSTSVSTALWKKAAEIAAYINASHPIGLIIWVRHTQELLPELPDPKYWKEMNGTAVSNSNSPLNGVVMPDLRGAYLKHPPTEGQNQTFGSSDTRNFSHNHGGVTGVTFPAGAFNADNDDERAGPFPHSHLIFGALGVSDIKPPYRGLRFYIRIV